MSILKPLFPNEVPMYLNYYFINVIDKQRDYLQSFYKLLPIRCCEFGVDEKEEIVPFFNFALLFLNLFIFVSYDLTFLLSLVLIRVT